MTYKKALEVMMQLKAEYFYAFKDMPDELFKIRIKNFMKALEDYSEKEVDIALGVVLKENKTLPTTASFVEVLERNRELQQPFPEEEWTTVSSVITRIRNNRNIDNVEKRHEQNQKDYNLLSDEVKEFYVNYSGFLDLLSISNLENAKARFLREFSEFRKKRKQQKELYKQLEMNVCVKKF